MSEPESEKSHWFDRPAPGTGPSLEEILAENLRLRQRLQLLEERVARLEMKSGPEPD